jgi:ribonuclease Z
VVVLGDTSDASAIAAAAQGCDLLVREVTYDDARADKARHWGHSTSRMTGEFAHEVGAKTLIITHFSARFTDTADASGNPETIRVADLVTETARHCPTTRVLAAEDLWTFEVPRE